jgi:putative protease
VQLVPHDFNYFIPSSQLAEWRRQLVSSLQQPVRVQGLAPAPSEKVPLEPYAHAYLYNAANREARRFYAAQGVPGATSLEAPVSQSIPSGEILLMQCRHCLRYSLGCCVKNGGEKPYLKEPLYLVSGDGRRFRLEFDCRNCQMNVYGK